MSDEQSTETAKLKGTAASLASEWNARRTPFDLELPDGRTVKVRRPKPDTFLKLRQLPQRFVRAAVEAAQAQAKGQDGPQATEGISPEEAAAEYWFACQVVASCLVEPKGVIRGEGDTRPLADGEVDIEGIPPQIFWFIFHAVMDEAPLQIGETEVTAAEADSFRQVGDVLRTSDNLRAEPVEAVAS